MVAIATATNCLTEAEDVMVAMLANSTAFQIWVRAADPDAAGRHIFLHSLPESADFAGDRTDVFPEEHWEKIGNYIVVSTAQQDGFAFDFDAMSAGYEYLGSGELMLELAQYFPRDETNWQENGRAGLNAMGDVLQSLAGMVGLFHPSLSVEQFRVTGWGWTPEDQIPAMGLHLYLDAAVRWSSGHQA
jgi:hypothetical protein